MVAAGVALDARQIPVLERNTMLFPDEAFAPPADLATSRLSVTAETPVPGTKLGC